MAEIKWVKDRMKDFVSQAAVMQTEDEIRSLCLAEVEYWRTGRNLAGDSLRNPHTQSRKLARESGLSEQKKALIAEYLSIGAEEWTGLNVAETGRLVERKVEQRLLTDPEQIARQAEVLLSSEKWSDLAAGLSAATGRRATEILKTAVLEPATEWTVLFSGQLKAKGNNPSQFEIPTLVPASLVLSAYERLRTMLDTEEMTEAAVSAAFNRSLNTSVKRHFEGLIPERQDDEITSHVLRAVYLRLAVFWYAPILVDADLYAARIAGHRSYADGKESESLAAGHHYTDYKVADASGQIDGRQGTRLDMPGVKVLEYFSESYRPVSGLSGASNGMVAMPVMKASVLEPESLYTGADLEAVKAGMMAAGEIDFVRYLKTGGLRQAHHDLGILKRDTVVDVSKMSMEQLARTRKPATAQERIRRAVAAIMEYNDAHVQLERWYINSTLISTFIGGRFEAITNWLKEHETEVDAHNKRYNLSVAYNRKPIDIKEVIRVE